MVRTCHLDTCPVGIATQRPELRAKFAATPQMVASYLLYVAEEVRTAWGRSGCARSARLSVAWICCARVKAVTFVRRRSTWRRFSFVPRERFQVCGRGSARGRGGRARRAACRGRRRHCRRDEGARAPLSIRNSDRAVGARLGGELGRVFGSGSPPGRAHASFEGVAGQSFGAFLASGVRLTLTGEANDYVGKGMSGGRIVIRPPADDAGEPVVVGNTALYGATGGALFCAGRAGERFAVRNSGAVAVVEGAGDHACEYMTDGTVVILGETGGNVGAGMTGGELYVYDVAERLCVRLNEQLVSASRPSADELTSCAGSSSATSATRARRGQRRCSQPGTNSFNTGGAYLLMTRSRSFRAHMRAARRGRRRRSNRPRLPPSDDSSILSASRSR